MGNPKQKRKIASTVAENVNDESLDDLIMTQIKEEGLESDLESSSSSDDDGDESSELDDSDDPEGSSASDDDDEDENDPSTSRHEIDEEDSSDDEDLRNTIGNIPVRWYDEEEHVGYDRDGNRIRKPAQRTEMEEFLARTDDPDYWRKVKDRGTGEELTLTKEQIETIHNITQQQYPEVGYNPYQPYVDFFTNEVMEHPVTNHPPQKREFIPSILDKQKVSKMVYAIKMGWMKPRQPKKPPKTEDELDVYDLWGTKDDGDKTKSETARMRMHIPAPKTALPTHEESYNPPPEYVPTEEEKAAWLAADPEDRERDFLPQKFKSLREVPGYRRFVEDRFQRCLDLYLAPRKMKMKLNIDPAKLLPDLPKPQDLRPFPHMEALMFKGHTGFVRAISVDPNGGQFFASGSEDGTVRLWEMATARCMTVLTTEEPIVDVAWSPDPAKPLVAFASGTNVFVVNAGLGDVKVSKETEAVLTKIASTTPSEDSEDSITKWSSVTNQEMEGLEKGQVGIKITHSHRVRKVVWQKSGDYLATVVAPEAGANAVLIHRLSHLKSQAPLTKSKGDVRAVLFHPTQPRFYIATARHVRVYNLAKQQLLKKLLPNCQSVSCMAIHPRGDNLLVGSHDFKITWFDMDLSAKPYKTLKYQKGAIRSVSYHPTLPLFATGSDDGTTLVSHGRVFSDLLQNALIVPLKVLRGHKTKSMKKDSTGGSVGSQGLGVLSTCFHPVQPWILTGGVDNHIRLYIE